MVLSLGSNKDQFKTEKHLKDLEDWFEKKRIKKEESDLWRTEQL